MDMPKLKFGQNKEGGTNRNKGKASWNMQDVVNSKFGFFFLQRN